MPLSPRSRLGAYEILGPLGAGGMGEVYRARDTRLGREVAVKVLPQHVSTSPEDRARFQREAKTISSLNHPNICVLHDIGREGDTDYLIMELVEGETLAQRLTRGPLPLSEAMRFAIDIAEGLAAAHGAGVVHRDLKPSNVMLTRAGAKLLDFGVAKRQPVPARTDVVTQDMATAPGIVVGTLSYMAPEQLEGRPVDARSDLFAFGAVLYEMLTGQRAFPGGSQAAVRGTPPAPSSVRPEVPRDLDRVVAASLAREPEERWQSARDVVRVLRWIANDADGDAPKPAKRRARSAWLPHAAWASLVLVLLLLPRTRERAPERAGSEPPPHPQPVVVLMDSPLQGRVYDPRTRAAGGTNADDITDAIRDLPLVVQKENTSAMWHREEQVVRERPDLIVSHFSCLLDERVGEGQSAVQEHLVELAANRLALFFGYVASTNARTRFIVYSRTAFADSAAARQWVGDAEARLPALRGRLHVFSVPGGLERATFRDPETARLMRERVRQVLALR